MLSAQAFTFQVNQRPLLKKDLKFPKLGERWKHYVMLAYI